MGNTFGEISDELGHSERYPKWHLTLTLLLHQQELGVSCMEECRIRWVAEGIIALRRLADNLNGDLFAAVNNVVESLYRLALFLILRRIGTVLVRYSGFWCCR